MPKATALWLIDNTSLTFSQIADFTGLHLLEIQAIADGEIAQGIRVSDPIAHGELTRAEISRAEQDPQAVLCSQVQEETPLRARGPRYVPISKRQDKPNAISWLLRNHSGIRDSQIAGLIGTTAATIRAVRTRTHRNMANITPRDPVLLGLCKQTELDALIADAPSKDAPKVEAAALKDSQPESQSRPEQEERSDVLPTPDALFSNHGDLSSSPKAEEAVEDEGAS